MRVDIGIACNKNQSHEWWPKVLGELLRVGARGQVEIGRVIAIGSAMPDISKNEAVGYHKRWQLTDVNRCAIVDEHLEGKSDAILWIDDDTVPPQKALERLVALGRPVAAGVYYKRKPPCNPIAYYRLENGAYAPLWEFQPGEIVNVDSVGMGCTLVQRAVYEKIAQEYVLFRRPTGTLVPIHHEDVAVTRATAKQVMRHRGKVLYDNHGNMTHLVPLVGPVPPEEVERWPYYVMEHERTEDHFFCEMVKRVGFEIVVDTSLECHHWGDSPISGKNFREMREYERRAREEAEAEHEGA